MISTNYNLVKSYCYSKVKGGVQWYKSNAIPAFAMKTAFFYGGYWALQYIGKEIAMNQQLAKKFLVTIAKSGEEKLIFLPERFPNAFQTFQIYANLTKEIAYAISDLFEKIDHTQIQFFCIPRSISSIASAIVMEEIATRGLFQKFLLPSIANRLPEKIKPLVDYKWTRIFVSSSIFALMHWHHWRTFFLGPIPQFLGGFVMGHIAEEYGLMASSIFHIGYDLQINFLTNESQCDLLNILRDVDFDLSKII